MKLLIVLSFILTCFSYLSYGQTIKTNEKGEKILVYSDGSWKYYDSNKEENKGLSSVVPQSLPSSESEVYTQINNLYNDSKDKEKSLIKSKEENRLERVLIEYNMRVQKNDLLPSEMKVLKEKLTLANKKSEEIDKEIKSNNKDSNTFFKMLNMESEKRKKAYSKYLSSISKYKKIDDKKSTLRSDTLIVQKSVVANEINTSHVQVAIEPVVKPVIENLKSIQNKVRTGEFYSKYNSANDVYLHPTTKKCKIEYEGIDEFSGKKRKDLVAEPLFFNTPEPMKKILEGKQYIYCTTALSTITGGTAFLTFNITIATIDAPRLFGGLEKGSIINIKFLDGENVAIINNRNDFGQIDANAKTTTYRAQCTLGSVIQKMLSTKEIDKIRFTWNAGYEDYEVYDVDLLIRQMDCL